MNENINKTHKYILLLIIAILAATFAFANISAAQDYPDIYPEVYTPTNIDDPKTEYVNRLPAGDWRLILQNVIQLILAITGSLTIIAFTVGGIMMVTSQGNEEQLSKGKAVLLWSVVALLIIAASYAIVLGITQLQLV